MKKRRLPEALLFIGVFLLFFALFASPMGLSNMLNTMMNTAYRLLMDTCFYLMAITVLAGAVSELLTAFGVVDLLNRLLSPLMKPLFGLPGAASLGVVTTYLSDNPAILTLASNNQFRRCFRLYQVPALTNLGTAFGMGLIVTTFVGGLGGGASRAVLCGNLGAVCGSILSTRLMLLCTARQYGRTEPALTEDTTEEVTAVDDTAKKPAALRVLDAVLSGGEKGCRLGLSIIPGVLIICTIVMMLTNGPGPGGVYTGAAYEGIGLLPAAASKIDFILRPLFGFSDSACIAVPVTALGSAGAALSLIPALVKSGAASGSDLAVFTAMCMCWSGYLSTHVCMMEALNCRKLTGKAILCHTLGGLAAGISAHWLYIFIDKLSIIL